MIEADVDRVAVQILMFGAPSAATSSGDLFGREQCDFAPLPSNLQLAATLPPDETAA